MKRIEIQGRITIPKETYEEILKRYENMSDNFGMGFNGKFFDKKGIIDEIRNLTDTGKMILMVDYRFRQSPHYKEMQKKLREAQLKNATRQ